MTLVRPLLARLVAVALMGCGDAASPVVAGAEVGETIGDAGRASAQEQRGGWPPACPLYTTPTDVEEHILLPKCSLAGDGSCHGSGRVSPGMVQVGMIADNVVDKPGHFRCTTDMMVSRVRPRDSYLLAKVRRQPGPVLCSNGTNGGPKMPYQDAPGLSDEEIACVEWWVSAIVLMR